MACNLTDIERTGNIAAFLAFYIIRTAFILSDLTAVATKLF